MDMSARRHSGCQGHCTIRPSSMLQLLTNSNGMKQDISDRQMTLDHIPHQKLLGGGVSTPFAVFGLICTIHSELKSFPDLYTSAWAGIYMRLCPVDGFDTCWMPRSFWCSIPRFRLGCQGVLLEKSLIQIGITIMLGCWNISDRRDCRWRSWFWSLSR